MENYRDTTLARFTTFWWGLALIFAFGLIAVVSRLVFYKDANDAEDERAVGRLEMRATVDMEQEALLAPQELSDGKVQLAPELVFDAIAPELLSEQPEAVRTAAAAVPDTETFRKMNSAASE